MPLDLLQLHSPLRGIVAGLQIDSVRTELEVTQIPSPKGLADESLALSINIRHENDEADHAVSRLVFAYSAEVPEGWNSSYRIIGYAKSPIDLEMARDEYLSNLPWEWLRESLIRNGARFSNDAGTSTTVISTGHGALIGQPQHAELEIRASWSPEGDAWQAHLVGWSEMVALISGLSPADENVWGIRGG